MGLPLVDKETTILYALLSVRELSDKYALTYHQQTSKDVKWLATYRMLISYLYSDLWTEELAKFVL